MIDHHPYELVDLSISFSVRFWLFFFTFLLSILCCIFVLYHLLFDRVLRRTLNNHVIIVLLFNTLLYALTSIPLHLSYYYLGTVLPAVPNLCLIWMFLDGGIFTFALILVAWASIERYILIFHDKWMSTRKKRLLIHYLPLAAIFIYCFIFHAVTILFSPCVNMFRYNLPLCGRPLCYYDMKLVALWDTITNNILPTLAIILFSIALLIRVLLQKHRMHQQLQWKKHRKMTIQLLSMSILYLFLYIPPMFVELMQQCCVSEDFGADFQLEAQFFSYYVICLFPFLSAMSLPKRKFKLKKLFSCWRGRKRTVGPETLVMAGLRQAQQTTMVCNRQAALAIQKIDYRTKKN
ncbi:unnamed protein product [Adineta steineri]|uniref:G-protein coupled receptors family 1 profile domain-containing protein n=1 Tax=Adineta steineri TaxID=433720 RepID=A0A814CNK1_9BILA|nr:unnamed protein product [Adineta steineri]CAF3917604.1 unnamed protein product [Adineta steineri]